MYLTDQRVLALIGPGCNWQRRGNRDAYACDHCRSTVTGILLHDLRRSLSR